LFSKRGGNWPAQTTGCRSLTQEKLLPGKGPQKGGLQFSFIEEKGGKDTSEEGPSPARLYRLGQRGISKGKKEILERRNRGGGKSEFRRKPYISTSIEGGRRGEKTSLTEGKPCNNPIEPRLLYSSGEVAAREKGGLSLKKDD